jgi:uncharacterized protein YwgA
MEMHRFDWLLLLLALSDSSELLDPVRLQKGMFLLAQEQGLEADERYDFVPYDYGPFSVDMYRDLDRLYEMGLVERVGTPGYSWSRYQPTGTGMTQAQYLVDGMDPQQRNHAIYLQDLKRTVLSMNFRDLLRYVYSRYPEFSGKSVFKG